MKKSITKQLIFNLMELLMVQIQLFFERREIICAVFNITFILPFSPSIRGAPPPPAMPPPSASAIATRFATHWIADALADDESFDFSVLQGEAPNPKLLRRSPERFRSLTWVPWLIGFVGGLQIWCGPRRSPSRAPRRPRASGSRSGASRRRHP
jgi:hypothetical protein